MAQRKVLVEICLTSNDLILGVRGHAASLAGLHAIRSAGCAGYRRQGVSRSDMTHEYLRAAETYNLSYSDLKHMARQSLEHSFLSPADRATSSEETRTSLHRIRKELLRLRTENRKLTTVF